MSTNSTKTVKGRISNKHGTEEYWILSVYTDTSKNTLRDNPFIPLAGELIVYDPDSVYDYPRFKFGDGVNNVDQLSFVTEELAEELAGKFSLTYFSVGTSTDGVTMQDLYNKITEEIGDGTWSFISISARNNFTGFLKMGYRGGYYEIKAFDPIAFKTFDGGGSLSSVLIDSFISDDVASSLGTWKIAATQDWVTDQGYVAGSGTSGSLVKWDGTNSVANGPALKSGGTGFLKEDGTWATPAFTDEKVKQSNTTTDKWRKIILSAQYDTNAGTATTEQTGQVYVTPGIEVQASTGNLRVSGNISMGGNTVATQTWVTNQKYLTTHQSLSHLVTLATEQEITAKKTFTTTGSTQKIELTNAGVKIADNEKGATLKYITDYDALVFNFS